MAKSAVVKKTIKNMLGGVSQQPPLQRLESQCEEMVNCIPSLTEFLKRRNGVRLVGNLKTINTDNLFIDFIIRGDNDAGIVTVDKDGNVTVYNLDGKKIGQAQNSYLVSSNPKDDIKLCTVRDYNFLVNTKKEVAENAGTEEELDKKLLVIINQVSYGETYHLRLKMKNKYGNCYIDTSYSVPEIPTEDITASRILSNLRVATEQRLYANFFCSGTPNYVAPLLVQQPPHPTQVLLGAGVGNTPNNIALIGTKCGHTNCNGVLLGVNAKINIVDIYENVAVANITGLDERIDLLNVNALTKTNYDFNILAKYKAEISDSSGGALTTTINHKCKSFSDLPVYAPDDYYVEVEGDDGQKNDNYYLKFKLSNDDEYSHLTMKGAEQQSGMGRGGWVETVKWGDDVTLNKDTMPVVLKINTDNITVETIDWKGRLAGDKETNPSPSFVGKTIKDIFFYNNRLGFITDDSVIMSEAGEYFNFYQTTALALLDSDPIDVAVSGTKVSSLKYVVPYAEGVFLYSDRSLYVLEYGDVLSTANVELKPILQFDTSLSAEPVVCDTSIYYIGRKGSYNQIREYKPTDQSDGYGYSNDITSHIPKYITGNVRKMCISLEDGIMFLINETNEVFCYSFIKDNGELLLSSWHKWTFTHPVLMGSLFQGYLYLVFKKEDNSLYLGKVAVSDVDTLYYDETGTRSDYISSYTYSPYYLRDSNGRVQDYPTIIRTMALKYSSGSEFKIVIDRKARKQEVRYTDKKRDFTRFLAASENKDVKIKIESVDDKPFNIIETDLEVVYASRS